MRLHRFYVTESIGSKKEITIHSDELANQLSRVFRLKTGDRVVLFDGSGFDFECTITDFGKSDQKVVTFSVEKKSESRSMSTRDIYLYAAIVKKDTFEWIVEKATELGVTKIIPVMAERSEKKNLNEERLKKIAIEASEQSGRGSVPDISPIVDLSKAFELAAASHVPAVAFHLEGESLSAHATTGSAALFIGPEGGWSPEEVEMFHTNKIPVVSLGTQVLRTETAVVAALSLTVFTK
jgi:16S rRNA (uracil1498-N3)-methyltransferase